MQRARTEKNVNTATNIKKQEAPPVAHRRLVSCLDVSGSYKPGEQPPTGYMNWHEWASVQHKAGLRQARCGKCSLMKYPQELSGETISMKATTRKYGGETVTLTRPVCNACAANDKLTP